MVFPRVANWICARCSALRAVNRKPYSVPKPRATLAGIVNLVSWGRGTSRVTNSPTRNSSATNAHIPLSLMSRAQPPTTRLVSPRWTPYAYTRFKRIAQRNPIHFPGGIFSHAFAGSFSLGPLTSLEQKRASVASPSPAARTVRVIQAHKSERETVRALLPSQLGRPTQPATSCNPSHRAHAPRSRDALSGFGLREHEEAKRIPS